MTSKLISRQSAKWRPRSNSRVRELEVEDFENVFPVFVLGQTAGTGLLSDMPLDVEIEISANLPPKHSEIVTLNIENRQRAKFESEPIELYVDP